VEFSFCLFFAKLVSYTFLFWLPSYIENTGEYLSNVFRGLVQEKFFVLDNNVIGRFLLSSLCDSMIIW